MRLGLQPRLLIAFAGSMALLVLAMAGAFHWSFQQGFKNYLDQVELERTQAIADRLAEAYGEQSSWDFLRHNRLAWDRLVSGTGLEPELPSRLGYLASPAGPGFAPRGYGPNGFVSPYVGPVGYPPGRLPPPGFGPPAPGLRPGPPPRQWDGQFPPMPPPQALRPPPRPPSGLLDLRPRLRLFDVDGQLVFGPPNVDDELLQLPVTWRGEEVGRLALRRDPVVTDQLALAFQLQQRHTYWLIAGLALLLAILASALLARRLLQPVKQIANAAHQLSAGRYTTRIAVDRNDELGGLAQDFNHLAAVLEKTEQTRRRWVADISHELRTPLAVLRGEIEALVEGVRPLSSERMQSLHGEVLRLGQLISDLYELALSDAGGLEYRRESVNVARVLDEVITLFEARFAKASVHIDNQVEGPITILGDDRRLAQVFSNLLENSLRYTDPQGQLRISVQRGKRQFWLRFEDSGPGVSDEALPLLFERLYRVDKSRSRKHGGAGLGLAICRNIVEAHGGQITATHSGLGGLSLSIELPVPK